jgi:hypothetical protein
LIEEDDNLRQVGKKPRDEVWLKKLGKRIESLIIERGYRSPYDFWIQSAGDYISRSALNYLIAGRYDPKVTTLRTLARLLGVSLAKLVTIKEKTE